MTVINIAFGILGPFAAVFLFVGVVGVTFISANFETMTITAVIGTAVAFFLAVTSVPEIIGGLGVLE